MKKISLVFLCCTLVLLLCGCSLLSRIGTTLQSIENPLKNIGLSFSIFNNSEDAPTVTLPTETPTEASETPTTEVTTEATTEPTTEATTEATTETPKENTDVFEIYMIQLSLYTDIYKRPTFDAYTGDYVEESNIYTIVDEQWDDYGNLWGKLKSGRGWIFLQEAWETNYTIQLSANTVIFRSPHMRSQLVGNVGKKDTYTIVAESCDDKGNIWGKLKSGLGWVIVES